MTLLETFNNYLDKTYMEPDRRGVAKGHEIGVFRSTHQALLYSLYNFDEKEKAKRAGISYVFLRKLRCTDRYKEHVFHRRLNFVEECVIQYLDRGHFFKYIPTPRREFDEKLDVIKVDHETAFADASLYDYETKKMISEWINTSPSDDPDDDEAGRMDRILHLLTNWNEPELNIAIYKKMVQSYSEENLRLLEGNEITDAMRDRAIRYSNYILKFSTII